MSLLQIHVQAIHNIIACLLIGARRPISFCRVPIHQTYGLFVVLHGTLPLRLRCNISHDATARSFTTVHDEKFALNHCHIASRTYDESFQSLGHLALL